MIFSFSFGLAKFFVHLFFLLSIILELKAVADYFCNLNANIRLSNYAFVFRPILEYAVLWIVVKGTLVFAHQFSLSFFQNFLGFVGFLFFTQDCIIFNYFCLILYYLTVYGSLFWSHFFFVGTGIEFDYRVNWIFIRFWILVTGLLNLFLLTCFLWIFRLHFRHFGFWFLRFSIGSM